MAYYINFISWMNIGLILENDKILNIRYLFQFFLRFFFQSLIWRLQKPPFVFWLFGTLVGIVAFLIIGVVLNMTYVFSLILVFLYHFSGIDLSSWIVSLIVSTTPIFLWSLDLRLIINKNGVMGLNFIFIFILIFLSSFVIVFLGW